MGGKVTESQLQLRPGDQVEVRVNDERVKVRTVSTAPARVDGIWAVGLLGVKSQVPLEWVRKVGDRRPRR